MLTSHLIGQMSVNTGFLLEDERHLYTPAEARVTFVITSRLRSQADLFTWTPVTEKS